MNWAKRQKVGGPGPKSILMALADYADERHSCIPGQALLADITEQSERTVRVHLAQMEQAGLFRRERRFRDEGRGRTSDRFFLAVDQPADSSGGNDQPADFARPTGNPRTTNRNAVAAHRTASDPKENRQSSKGAARRIPDDFTTTDAMREWAITKAPLVDLDDETENFVDYWRSTGKTKADWDATWKFWMRRTQKTAEDRTRPHTNGRPVPNRPMTTVERSWRNIMATEPRS